MKSAIFALAFLATSALSIALPQDVDNNDIPTQCTSVCQSVVTLTQQCDRQINDNDQAYRNCVCNAQGASTVVPICEACVRQFRPNTTDDDGDVDTNDVDDIVRACSFTTTAYNPSQTSSLSIGSATATATSTNAGSAITSAAGGVSGTVGSVVGSATSNAGSVASSLASSATRSVATATTNGAGAMVTARAGAGLAAIIGVAALL